MQLYQEVLDSFLVPVAVKTILKMDISSSSRILDPHILQKTAEKPKTLKQLLFIRSMQSLPTFDVEVAIEDV